MFFFSRRASLLKFFFTTWALGLSAFMAPGCDDSNRSVLAADGFVDASDNFIQGTDLTDLRSDAVDTAPQVTFTTPPPQQTTWRDVGVFSLDGWGSSETIAIDFPDDQRFIAVRTFAGEGTSVLPEGLCYRLEPAALASGEQLVAGPEAQDNGAVCSDCVQFVSMGQDAGVFVFSTTPDPLSEGDTLTFNVSLRDCALGVKASRARFPQMPSHVEVEVAWEAAPSSPEAATLGVRIVYTENSGFQSPLNEDPLFAVLWAEMQARFDAEGIELSLEAELALDATFDHIEYGPGNASTLRDLQATFLSRLSRGSDDVRFIPIALVNCLAFENTLLRETSRPSGQTTRIPGLLSVKTSPSLVLLATGRCFGDDDVVLEDPAHFGRILAHEVGHYLGLYHTDVPAGAQLYTGPSERLMTSGQGASEADSAWFSDDQSRVMRRHPAVRFAL